MRRLKPEGFRLTCLVEQPVRERATVKTDGLPAAIL